MTFVLLKLPSGLVLFSIYTLHPFWGATQGISSRLFSNFSISSVCPNSPGWVLLKRKHSSSNLWCYMIVSPTDEPLLLPTSVHSLLSSLWAFPTDPVGINAVFAAEKARQAWESATVVPLHVQNCCRQGKTLQYHDKLGPCKVGTAPGRQYTFSEPKLIKLVNLLILYTDDQNHLYSQTNKNEK